MTREHKSQVIAELTEKFQNSSYFYLADAAGLTVPEINDFRRACFNAGVEYKVYKNTLIQKALEAQEGDFSAINEALKGYTGVMFTTAEAASAPAKILKDFRKANEKPLLKAASIDGDIILGDENIDSLSKLKSKDELIGEIIGLLQSPAKNVISALQSSGQTLSGILKTLSEREAA